MVHTIGIQQADYNRLQLRHGKIHKPRSRVVELFLPDKFINPGIQKVSPGLKGQKSADLGRGNGQHGIVQKEHLSAL